MIKISDDLLNDISDRAKNSGRKRINFNFHKDYKDAINRMLNAIEPGSYIRPHKHDTPDKREIFLIVKGKMAVVEFNEEGNIIDHTVLDSGKGIYGVEIAPKVWHTILSLEKRSVVYEIKDGPYEPVDDKNFAAWAPEENDIKAADYLKGIIEKLNLY